MTFLPLRDSISWDQVPLLSQFIHETLFQAVYNVLIILSQNLVPTYFQCLREDSCQKTFFSSVTKVTYVAGAKMFLIPITQNAPLPG